MFALAVLLLVAAAAIILWVLFGLNGEHNNTVHFHGFGVTADLKPLTVFALGALTLLLIWAAVHLITLGAKRGVRRRRERKEIRKENKQYEKEHDHLVAERNQAVAERNHVDHDAYTHHNGVEGERFVDGDRLVDPERVRGEGDIRR